MRFEAEGTEQQRLRSGVIDANPLSGGGLGDRPLMCEVRATFSSSLRFTPERNEKAAQAVDRCGLAATPKRLTKRAQRRLRQQRRTERIERLGFDAVLEHLEPDRRRHHERRLQPMQAGDPGITAKIKPRLGVEPGQRRLDFG